MWLAVDKKPTGGIVECDEERGKEGRKKGKGEGGRKEGKNVLCKDYSFSQGPRTGRYTGAKP